MNEPVIHFDLDNSRELRVFGNVVAAVIPLNLTEVTQSETTNRITVTEQWVRDPKVTPSIMFVSLEPSQKGGAIANYYEIVDRLLHPKEATFIASQLTEAVRYCQATWPSITN